MARPATLFKLVILQGQQFSSEIKGVDGRGLPGAIVTVFAPDQAETVQVLVAWADSPAQAENGVNKEYTSLRWQGGGPVISINQDQSVTLPRSAILALRLFASSPVADERVFNVLIQET